MQAGTRAVIRSSLVGALELLASLRLSTTTPAMVYPLPGRGTSPPGRPGTRGTSQDLDHWLDLSGHTTTGWESHNPRYRSTSSGAWRRHSPKDTYRNPTMSSACSVPPAPPVHLVILSFTHSYSPSLKYTHSILTQTFLLVLTI